MYWGTSSSPLRTVSQGMWKKKTYLWHWCRALDRPTTNMVKNQQVARDKEIRPDKRQTPVAFSSRNPSLQRALYIHILPRIIRFDIWKKKVRIKLITLFTRHRYKNSFLQKMYTMQNGKTVIYYMHLDYYTFYLAVACIENTVPLYSCLFLISTLDPVEI